MNVFEYPETGKTHLLRSNPRQKTVKYPVSDEFHAESYCGCASVKLRHGDLDELPFPEADALDTDRNWCQRCVEVGPIVPSGEADEMSEERANATSDNYEGITSY